MKKKLMRDGPYVFEDTTDGWRLYATFLKGSWCKLIVGSGGVSEYEPLDPDEQVSLSAMRGENGK